MSSLTSDAFLQGQGIPVDPRAIEDELAQLWGPAAEQAGGPDLENPTVTRVVLANLIVARPRGDGARIDDVLDTVVSRYPCRAIELRQTNDGERRVRAEISALCHLPAPGLPQVCSERIVLGAGSGALDLLPGAVRPLLEPDLPTVLWWADDPRATEALFRELANEATRLLIDLPDPGADPEAIRAGLDPTRHPFARDIAWFGVTRWREMIAQCFDPGCARGSLGEIAKVEIRAVAPVADDRPPRVSAWLAAWLAGQLDWKPAERKQPVTGHCEAVFRSADGRSIEVQLTTVADPSIPFTQATGVTLTAHGADGPSTFTLNRPATGSEEVRIEIRRPGHPDLQRTVLIPEFDPAQRVAAALESTRDDPPFRAAAPHAIWLLGG